MTRGIPEFEWDFGDKKEKYEEKSEYLKFRIEIDGAYKWGRGWTAQEEREFKDYLYPMLRSVGFNITPGRSAGSSDEIRGTSFLDKTYVYLHPMEFTGYAKAEDISKMCGILYNAPKKIVKSVPNMKTSEVSWMDDRAYENLLVENSGNIADWIDRCKEVGIKYDFGQIFAENFRIERLGDHSGLSSGDVDWRFVDNLDRIRDSLSKYEKDAEEDISR